MSALDNLGVKYPEDLDYIYFVDPAGKACRHSTVLPVGYQGRYVIPNDCEQWQNSGKTLVQAGDTIVVTSNYMAYYYSNKEVATNDYSSSILGLYYTANNSTVPTGSVEGSFTPTDLVAGTSVLDVHHYNDGYFQNNCSCSNATTGNVGGVDADICLNLYGVGTCNSNLPTLAPTIPNPTPVINVPTQQLSAIFWTLIVITGIVILAAIIIAGLVIFGVFKGGEKVLESAKESAEIRNASPSSKGVPPKGPPPKASIPARAPPVTKPPTGDASLAGLSNNIF